MGFSNNMKMLKKSVKSKVVNKFKLFKYHYRTIQSINQFNQLEWTKNRPF